jgi:hypothetical protein
MGNHSAKTQPVSMVIHDRLMPGSAIANRLVDRGWRVHTHSGADAPLQQLRRHKPMLVVVQLDLRGGDVDLAHMAVLAYGPLANGRLRDAAIAAGAQVVAADSSILEQLPNLIEAALAVD